jgi:HlyD family secretion protein
VELAQQGLLSKGEGDTALATADAADASVVSSQAAVVQAKASQTRAETNLAYTRISSPTDGVVISRSVDVGQTVAASMSAPILFTIAQDLRQMQVNTSVAESDVGRLRAEMPASFTVDAYPGERFQGKVRQVRDVATTTQNVVTYDAVIDVDNPDLKLKPGMTANVTFTYARREDTLRVPNAALRFRPPESLNPVQPVAAAEAATSASAIPASTGGTARPASRGAGMRGVARGGGSPSSLRTVWVLRDGVLTGVNVTTGITDGSFTEIVGGELKAGDTLVTDVLGAAATGTPGRAPRMF